jgi:glycogen synthase
VFVTPELGKWSTVGGLGVMVDELSIGLAELGLEVICVSPYYHVNRKGGTDYLRADGITYTGRNVAVYAGSERIEMGVHEGKVKGVRLFFLHNSDVFPRPYPPHDAFNQIRVMAAFAKGTLELLCQWRLIPGVVVTNDWFTGLVPAYARHGHFGDAFQRTDFMHIAHNLDPDYEGRMWPTPAQGTLGHVHGLPSDLLVDPHWHDVVINPTRAALLCSDTWATVSRSYRADLLSGSPLRSLLRLAPHPFAHPNGIPVKARASRLASLATPTHEDAKAALQRKYFGFAAGDASIPLFAFVGRITLQKGVHLILQAVDELLRVTGGRAMFLVGGMASGSDTYGLGCAHVMRDLAARHPSRFWANPDLFFTDGDMVNLGADFCLMPSMFEPGGIVQQEFFVAGTPVIAFKTGGLKDTVHEWHPGKRTGNGFTFEAHNAGDFSAAVHRALAVYADPGGAYAQLRANARASVMDLAVVSLGWAREFYRLRRCLPPAPTPPAPEALVPFAITVGEVPGLSADSVVELTGSWTSWARKYPLALEQPGRRVFSASLPLPPGTFQFKFVVDGVWTAAPSLSTVDDGTGNINNVVSVAPPRLDDDE